MRVIIAGSRSITDYELVSSAIRESGFTITEVVSGGARGVDVVGEQWAKDNGVPVRQFLPQYDPENFRTRWTAPMERNSAMAEYAAPDGALILVWDGKSKGSQDMFKKAAKKNLKIYVKSTAG